MDSRSDTCDPHGIPTSDHHRTLEFVHHQLSYYNTQVYARSVMQSRRTLLMVSPVGGARVQPSLSVKPINRIFQPTARPSDPATPPSKRGQGHERWRTGRSWGCTRTRILYCMVSVCPMSYLIQLHAKNSFKDRVDVNVEAIHGTTFHFGDVSTQSRGALPMQLTWIALSMRGELESHSWAFRPSNSRLMRLESRCCVWCIKQVHGSE
jgi:hypothetical protein